jgi:hypothetical protein
MDARIAQLRSFQTSTPEVMRRASVARQQFCELSPELRAALLTLASQYNIVLRRLALGDWQSLLRVLVGLAVHNPDANYEWMIAELDRSTINALAQ